MNALSSVLFLTFTCLIGIAFVDLTAGQAPAASCINGSVKSHPNCLWFYNCVNGAWVVTPCPEQMIFSDGQCRFQWTAKCQTGSCIPGGKAPAPPQDCTQYLLCSANGTQVLTSCALSTWRWYHFNANTLQCEIVSPWTNCP